MRKVFEKISGRFAQFRKPRDKNNQGQPYGNSVFAGFLFSKEAQKNHPASPEGKHDAYGQSQNDQKEIQMSLRKKQSS